MSLRSIACVLALSLGFGGCGRAGNFDRARLEHIVANVRPLVTTPGQLYMFSVDDALDPSSLAPLPPTTIFGRGDGRGRIRAIVTADHQLAVSIETRDAGHAGESGFLFTDGALSDTDLEGTRLDSQHEDRIDANWVRWDYDLD